MNNSHKLSQYVIATDPFSKGKFRVVYSSRSGKINILKEEIYQSLLNGHFENNSDEILAKLKNDAILVPAEEDELRTIIDENHKVVAGEKALYYAIQPSANCQLGCGYCGQVHTADKIKKDYYANLLSRIEEKLETNSQYETLSIAWFGGEPLMGLSNIKELSDKFQEMAKDRGMGYHAKMVTNGLALKRKIFYDLVENYKLNFFEVTLDGTAEYHDTRRHTKSGNKSFDLILKNIIDITSDPRFETSKASINIRCNVDATNHEGVEGLIELLDGLDLLSKVGFYTAPIHSWGNDAHLASLEKNDYAAFEISCLQKVIKSNPNKALVPTQRKPVVCMTVKKDSELVDAFGNVYNCTEVSQVPTYEKRQDLKINNIKEKQKDFNAERPMSNWYEDVADGKFPCSTCSILPICGGQCPKSWYEDISPCPSIKFNIKERLMLHVIKNAPSKKQMVPADV